MNKETDVRKRYEDIKNEEREKEVNKGAAKKERKTVRKSSFG